VWWLPYSALLASTSLGGASSFRAGARLDTEGETSQVTIPCLDALALPRVFVLCPGAASGLRFALNVAVAVRLVTIAVLAMDVWLIDVVSTGAIAYGPSLVVINVPESLC
jgi:hypothetical protein